MSYTTPTQRPPQRTRVETTIGNPNHTPTVPGAGIAPNIGGNPSANPTGAQLNTYLVGREAALFTITANVAANSFSAFGNIPFSTACPNIPTYQGFVGSATSGLSTAQKYPMVVQAGAVLFYHAWISQKTSSLVAGAPVNLITARMFVNTTVTDANNQQYNGQAQLPGGTTYTQFGITGGVLFYNPTGAAIFATTQFEVYAELFIVYPTGHR